MKNIDLIYMEDYFSSSIMWHNLFSRIGGLVLGTKEIFIFRIKVSVI